MNIYSNKWGKYPIPKEIYYTYTAQTIIDGEVHEDTTIDYIRSVGGNVIHAGSGFGDFLPALQNCNKVWTFEPNPLMYECSLKTIDLNNLTNVRLFNCAIGESDCSNFLKVIDSFGNEMGPRSEIGKNGIRIDMVKLDSVIPKNEKINLIHLDLEGHEFEALKGASEIIKRDKPIIILEIESRAVVYNDFMKSIGYKQHKQLIYNSSERMVFVNTVYVPEEGVEVGKEYWSSELPRPLSPDDNDVEIYKQNILLNGKTLLLGLTKRLTSLSDFQMDSNPWYDSETIIKMNWENNTNFFDTIIADGALNFNQNLTQDILEMAQRNSKVFICRTFTKKLDIMRVADFFPNAGDFTIQPTKVIEFKNYSFYIWHF